MSELEKLKHELEVTDLLLNERQKLLDAIPECPVHGKCIPHALEWIEKHKGQEIECAVKVGMIIEFTTNNNWDRKGFKLMVQAYSIDENIVCLGGHVISVDEFLRNIKTGRYKVVKW
jgi:methyl coenzyme M reductase subunit D